MHGLIRRRRYCDTLSATVQTGLYGYNCADATVQTKPLENNRAAAEPPTAQCRMPTIRHIAGGSSNSRLDAMQTGGIADDMRLDMRSLPFEEAFVAVRQSFTLEFGDDIRAYGIDHSADFIGGFTELC